MSSNMFSSLKGGWIVSSVTNSPTPGHQSVSPRIEIYARDSGAASLRVLSRPCGDPQRMLSKTNYPMQCMRFLRSRSPSIASQPIVAVPPYGLSMFIAASRTCAVAKC